MRKLSLLQVFLKIFQTKKAKRKVWTGNWQNNPHREKARSNGCFSSKRQRDLITKVAPGCASHPQHQDVPSQLQCLDNIFRRLLRHAQHMWMTQVLNLHFGTFRNPPVLSSEFTSCKYTSKYLLIKSKRYWGVGCQCWLILYTSI